MDLVRFFFVVYGVAILFAPAYGVWRPQQYIEWIEGRFIYRRLRLTTGIVMLVLGMAPVFWLIDAGWRSLLLIFCGIMIIKGFLMIFFPDLLRSAVITLGEADPKRLRIFFFLAMILGLLLAGAGVVT